MRIVKRYFIIAICLFSLLFSHVVYASEGGETADEYSELLKRIEALEARVSELEALVDSSNTIESESTESETTVSEGALSEEDCVGKWEYVYTFTDSTWQAHYNNEMHSIYELSEGGYGVFYTIDSAYNEGDANYKYESYPCQWKLTDEGLLETTRLLFGSVGYKISDEDGQYTMADVTNPECIFVKIS